MRCHRRFCLLGLFVESIVEGGLTSEPSFDGGPKNFAFGSMRVLSHGQTTRSTLTFLWVTHFTGSPSRGFGEACFCIGPDIIHLQDRGARLRAAPPLRPIPDARAAADNSHWKTLKKGASLRSNSSNLNSAVTDL